MIFKELFLDSKNKLSFGRVIAFVGLICSIVLFIVTMSFNWYQVKIQIELFSLIKFMLGFSGGTYTASKLLDNIGGKND